MTFRLSKKSRSLEIRDFRLKLLCEWRLKHHWWYWSVNYKPPYQSWQRTNVMAACQVSWKCTLFIPGSYVRAYQQDNTHHNRHKQTPDPEWQNDHVKGMVSVRKWETERERERDWQGDRAVGGCVDRPVFRIGWEVAAEFRTSGTACAAFQNIYIYTHSRSHTNTQSHVLMITGTQLTNPHAQCDWSMTTDLCGLRLVHCTQKNTITVNHKGQKIAAALQAFTLVATHQSVMPWQVFCI